MEKEKYISRGYLEEKWNLAKTTMEGSLDIYNLDKPNRITQQEAECAKGLREVFNAILKELGV